MLQSIEEVLRDELRQVKDSRALRLGANSTQKPAAESLIGLAFSGGGIRSATFNLGVLQAFAQERLLHAFDYLSTVSGGGYIGGWLMGWMKHAGIGIGEIEKQLASQPYSTAAPGDPPQVHFLRDYSNYLTPRKGILSDDFWAFMGSYLRNTILNLMILLLSLLSVLMVPRAIEYIPQLLEMEETSSWALRIGSHVVDSQYLALFLGFVLGAVGVAFIGANLTWVNPPKGIKYPAWSKQGPIQLLIVVPLFVSAGLLSYGYYGLLLWWPFPISRAYAAPIIGVVLYLGVWFGAYLFCKAYRKLKKIPKQNVAPWWMLLLTAFGAGAIGGYLLLPFGRVLLAAWPDKYFWPNKNWHVLTFGTPLLVGIMMLAGVLHLGLMGRRMTDEYREWWGRLGGWLMIYSLSWLFLFLMAVYVPIALGKLWASPFHYKYTFTGAATWVVATLYGIISGKNGEISQLVGDTPRAKKIRGYLARVTPYIFILGLLAALAILDRKIVSAVAGDSTPLQFPPGDIVDYWTPILCGVFFLAAVLISRRVDINEFSTHLIYRNRLVRCYLGASVPGRNSQPFTGFSSADDIPLADLQIPHGSKDPQHARPIPILNTSLNVSRGKELALQTRKARSFMLTPASSGFSRAPRDEQKWESFYAPTVEAGSERPGGERGLTLGTAVAISGAAASPNMGFYSSPPLAFMMTLFDVRLGWWIGNPSGPNWKRGGPRLGFYWLLCELFGTASDDSRCVYLSDGGHFENLAIYELVRRRCRLIVASDASCDPCYGFADLRNAIERCRTDFGVEIEMTGLDALKPQNGLSTNHFAVGSIHYTPGKAADDGTIIYLKPTLLKEDSADLVGYPSVNPHFPHDSTANQWFDETHFENYRALGKAVGAAASEEITSTIEALLA